MNLKEVKLSNIIALTFFLISGGALLLFSKLSGVDDRQDGNILFQIVSLLIYIITIFFFIIRDNKLLNIFSGNLLLMLLVFFCFISIFWSYESGATFRRSVALILTFFYCASLVEKFSFDKILEIYSTLFSIILVSSILAIFIPGWGIDNSNLSYSSAVRGLTGHKNDLGRYLAIYCILLIVLYKFSYFSLKKFVFYLVPVLIMLLLTQSKTPLACLLFTIIAIPLVLFILKGKSAFDFRVYYTKGVRLLILFLLLPTILICVFYSLYWILDVLGKDLTLTGRTTIWEYGFIKSEGNFWFGAGYRAFWGDALTSDFYLYNPYWESGKTFSNGHNGFIDVYFELGIIGVIFYFLFLVSYVVKVFNCKYEPLALFSSLIILFYFIYSITEQITLKQSELLWMLIMINYLFLSKEGRKIV